MKVFHPEIKGVSFVIPPNLLVSWSLGVISRTFFIQPAEKAGKNRELPLGGLYKSSLAGGTHHCCHIALAGTHM